MKPILTLEERSALIKAASAGTPGVTDAQLERVIEWAEDMRTGLRLSNMAIKGDLAIRVPHDDDEDFAFSLTAQGRENAERVIEKLFMELMATIAKEIEKDVTAIVEGIKKVGGQ